VSELQPFILLYVACNFRSIAAKDRSNSLLAFFGYFFCPFIIPAYLSKEMVLTLTAAMVQFLFTGTLLAAGTQAFAPTFIAKSTHARSPWTKLYGSSDLEKLASDTPFVEFDLTLGKLTENGGTPWTSVIGLGTPPQNLKFMIDTGTLNTWITSSDCQTDACLAHKAFDSARSTTFQLESKTPEDVDFGPWGTMTVLNGTDVARLDLEHAPLNVDIMLATKYTGEQFKELACDGGMAVPSTPDNEATALLEALKKEGIIKYGVASFYFNPSKGTGECRMGSLNTDRFDMKTMQVVDLIKNCEPAFDYLWTVNLDAFVVGNKAVAKNIQFVLDTGASWFKGGKGIIKTIVNNITDGTLPTRLTSEEQLADYPEISLHISGRTYTLTPVQYFLKVGEEWVLGFHHLKGLPDQMLLVGSTFLDTVYCAYDLGEDTSPSSPRVILAMPKNDDNNEDVNVAKSFDIGSSTWTNEFNSTLDIGPIADDGTFHGLYKSSTGATGVYPVVGVADPSPVGNSQAVSFSVTWRSLKGEYDPSWHFVSGFTGLVQNDKSGQQTLKTVYLLQQNADVNVEAYMATAVYPSTFIRTG
jgi:hypothetical protein